MSEPDVQSFIIKLWTEESAERRQAATWRGYITHVPSGERRYLKELGDITAFITPYLEAVGVRTGVWRRVGRWLKHAKP